MSGPARGVALAGPVLILLRFQDWPRRCHLMQTELLASLGSPPHLTDCVRDRRGSLAAEHLNDEPPVVGLDGSGGALISFLGDAPAHNWAAPLARGGCPSRSRAARSHDSGANTICERPNCADAS
jgi:hypothetical protein